PVVETRTCFDQPARRWAPRCLRVRTRLPAHIAALTENRPATLGEVAVGKSIELGPGAQLEFAARRNLDICFRERLIDLAAKARVAELGKRHRGLEATEPRARVENDSVCVLHPAQAGQVVPPV